MAQLRIINKSRSNVIQVGDVAVGDVFHFTQKVHQSCDRKDVYIRIHASESYQPVPDCWQNKVSVVNLTRGTLSLVAPYREVIPVQRAALEVS